MRKVEAIIESKLESGYFVVTPLVGGLTDSVLAVDVFRVNPAIGSVMTLVQVDKKYGIIPRSNGLPGIIQLATSTREIVKATNPAQFCSLWIARQLGNYHRPYATGNLISITGTGASVSISSGKNIGQTRVVSVFPSLSSNEFLPGDEILIYQNSGRLYLVGWWEPSKIWSNFVYSKGKAIIYLLDDNKNTLPYATATIWQGTYSFPDGIYTPFNFSQQISAYEDGRIELPDTLLPNSFKIQYTDGIKIYRKIFNARSSIPLHSAAVSAGFYSGSRRVFFSAGSLPPNPAIDDFNYCVLEMSGDMNAPAGWPYLDIVYQGSGTFSLANNGVWNIVSSGAIGDATPPVQLIYPASVRGSGTIKIFPPEVETLNLMSSYRGNISGLVPGYDDIPTSFYFGINGESYINVKMFLYAEDYNPEVIS